MGGQLLHAFWKDSNMETQEVPRQEAEAGEEEGVTDMESRPGWRDWTSRGPIRRRLRGSVRPGNRGLWAPSVEDLVWVMMAMGMLRAVSNFPRSVSNFTFVFCG